MTNDRKQPKLEPTSLLAGGFSVRRDLSFEGGDRLEHKIQLRTFSRNRFSREAVWHHLSENTQPTFHFHDSWTTASVSREAGTRFPLLTLAEVKTKEILWKGSCCFCFIVSKCNAFCRLFHCIIVWTCLHPWVGVRNSNRCYVFRCYSTSTPGGVHEVQAHFWFVRRSTHGFECINISSPITHKNHREHKGCWKWERINSVSFWDH